MIKRQKRRRRRGRERETEENTFSVVQKQLSCDITHKAFSSFLKYTFKQSVPLDKNANLIIVRPCYILSTNYILCTNLTTDTNIKLMQYKLHVSERNRSHAQSGELSYASPTFFHVLSDWKYTFFFLNSEVWWPPGFMCTVCNFCVSLFVSI